MNRTRTMTIIAGMLMALGLLAGCNQDETKPTNPLAEPCATGFNVSADACKAQGLEFGVKIPEGKTVAKCGTKADMVQPGTVFYTDGTSGYSKQCQAEFK